MPENQQKRTCPDCESALQPIKLLDKWGAFGERKVFEELTYASGDAEPHGFFVDSYRPEGTVQAFICTSCRRIILYGGDASAESKASECKDFVECPSCRAMIPPGEAKCPKCGWS